MTEKELGYLEEAIKSEAQHAKVLAAAGQMARDPELRRMFEEEVPVCLRRVDELMRELHRR